MKTKINYLLILVLAGFVLTGCCSMKQCGSCKVKQWEYKALPSTTSLSMQGNPSEIELNKLAADGWILVGVVPDGTGGNINGNVVFYLKRPKQ